MTPKPRAAAKPSAKKTSRRERLSQIRQALGMTVKSDSKFLPVVLGTFFGVFAVILVIGFLLNAPIIFGVLGLFSALMAAMVMAGRRASTVQFSRIEGQPGAALAVLGAMRGDWRVTQAVEFTKNAEFVHRVIARPGVILIAEGAGARRKELIGTHARKVRRVIGDKPIYDILIGDGEGEVPLRKLQTHLMKLPRNLKPKEVNELEARLKAVGGPNMPIPKGPMPRGKMR